MIIVPAESLSEQLLSAIIEDYVTREGTDYGLRETDLAAKVAQVHRQIERGEVLITFDEETESCNLLSKAEFDASQKLIAK